MNDWGRSVLTQYELEVTNVRKVRGALLCETTAGPKLLQRYMGSEKRLYAEAFLLQKLHLQGMEDIDHYVENKEGKLFSVNEYQEQYVLKDWFEGEECGIFDTKRLLTGMSRLAELHQNTCSVASPGDAEAPTWSDFCGNSCMEEMEKHNRELRKIYTYMKERRHKTAFETCVLQSFPETFAQAKQALEGLKDASYNEVYEDAKRRGSVVHGEYNYHNLIATKNGIAIVNFSKFGIQAQIVDVYDYLRKIMEKYGWDVNFGEQLVETYHRRMPLSTEQCRILGCLLWYPEKYWKQLNFFYNGSKAWISAKSIEKLSRAVQQCKEREEFVTRVLGITL